MKVLTARYNVDGLTQDEIDGLTLEVAVQGESSEHHPDVDVVFIEIEEIDDRVIDHGLDVANVEVTGRQD